MSKRSVCIAPGARRNLSADLTLGSCPNTLIPVPGPALTRQSPDAHARQHCCAQPGPASSRSTWTRTQSARRKRFWIWRMRTKKHLLEARVSLEVLEHVLELHALQRLLHPL
eukprot:2225460-Rhodomonas_salina.1